jgi:hypothetical protein
MNYMGKVVQIMKREKVVNKCQENSEDRIIADSSILRTNNMRRRFK